MVFVEFIHVNKTLEIWKNDARKVSGSVLCIVEKQHAIFFWALRPGSLEHEKQSMDQVLICMRFSEFNFTSAVSSSSLGFIFITT